MKYYIQRGINEYGPYNLADLQRYVASGNILLADLTRNEGMTDWVPVSQVIGNIPIPVPAAPAATSSSPVHSGTPVAGSIYGAAPAYSTAPRAVGIAGPTPPDLHWGLVLLIGSFTCGIFYNVWILIQASYIRKIRLGNKGMPLIIGGLAAQLSCFIALFAAGAAAAASGRESSAYAGVGLFYLLLLGGIVLYKIGEFQMRSGLLEYYNAIEPINLRLSSVMTFFFAIFYFQHHLSRIAMWKKTGFLEPQQ
jgi:hypothetical protein